MNFFADGVDPCLWADSTHPEYYQYCNHTNYSSTVTHTGVEPWVFVIIGVVLAVVVGLAIFFLIRYSMRGGQMLGSDKPADKAQTTPTVVDSASATKTAPKK